MRVTLSLLSPPSSSERWRIVKYGLLSKFWRKTKEEEEENRKPKSSEVLTEQLRQREYPHWTAWYVPSCDVRNDLFGLSHFNHSVDGRNYHVLRTGAFPFIKFHCSRRSEEDLRVENVFYNVLKVLNLGIPTVLYGLAGLVWATHTEKVIIPSSSSNERKTRSVTVYFWYRETRLSKH